MAAGKSALSRGNEAERTATMLLHEFLADHRVDLIARCRAKVVKHAHCATAEQLQNGAPMLLNQLVQTLRSEQERC
jgi:hypothetical protein